MSRKTTQVSPLTAARRLHDALPEEISGISIYKIKNPPIGGHVANLRSIKDGRFDRDLKLAQKFLDNAFEALMRHQTLSVHALCSAAGKLVPKSKQLELDL